MTLRYATHIRSYRCLGHRTYAYACVVHVNQPLSVQCFILVILGFSIPAFNFWYSGIPAFSNTHCEFPFCGSDSFRSSELKETNARTACNVKWPVYSTNTCQVHTCLQLMWIESVLCQWSATFFCGLWSTLALSLKLQIELSGIHWSRKVSYLKSRVSYWSEEKQRRWRTKRVGRA